MSFATYAEYLAALPNVEHRIQMAGASMGSTRSSLWTVMLPTVTAPSTAANCVGDTPGSFGRYYSTHYNRLMGVVGRGTASGTVESGGMLLLYDRLCHQGGLSGVTTGAQTTNLPTTSLVRYTNGIGVWPMVEIYTQIGTTQTTLTLSYTNTADTAGQTSVSFFGGTGFREANRAVIMPFASGDIGVKSVQSATLAVSTGTAGNFGISLIKPLALVPLLSADYADEPNAVFGGMVGRLTTWDTNACLAAIVHMSSNVVPQFSILAGV